MASGLPYLDLGHLAWRNNQKFFRMDEGVQIALWGTVHFLSSLWTSVTNVFSGILQSLVLLD